MLVWVLVALSEAFCAGSRKIPAVMAGDGTLLIDSSFDFAILPCIYSFFFVFFLECALFCFVSPVKFCFPGGFFWRRLSLTCYVRTIFVLSWWPG